MQHFLPCMGLRRFDSALILPLDPFAVPAFSCGQLQNDFKQSFFSQNGYNHLQSPSPVATPKITFSYFFT
jgi:hypothetical protein